MTPSSRIARLMSGPICMLLALVFSIVFIGYGSPVEAADEGKDRMQESYRPSGSLRDEEIAQDVRLRLDRNGFVDRHQVAVTVIDGTVYLTGTVDSPQEKLRAEYAAAPADGVMDIVNQLQVASEKAPNRDGQIRHAIEDELRKNLLLSGESIQVSVQEGTATLTGTVGTMQKRRAAEKTAYEGGALKVRNELQVLTDTP
jgi:osmotically-inducible protein OsmY